MSDILYIIIMAANQLHAVLLLPFLLGLIQAYNPVEGSVPRRKCLKGRPIRGCNETFLDAYKGTEMSKSDENGNEAETYFMLFTRKNKKNPEYIDQCGNKLPVNTVYNCRADTVLIVHGYSEGPCAVAWPREIKDQLLYRDNYYNVIIVDWTWGNGLDYGTAIKNGEITGKQIAFLIINIMREKCISALKFHIIGHSLGAQVAAAAGRTFYRLTGKKIRRITALDAAAPGFRNSDKCLKKSDAKLVDAIHTNAGECLPISLGLEENIGHADFYPNGGSVQFSCIPYTVVSFIKRDVSYATSSLQLPFCFHKQSVQFFKVSINSCHCQFVAVKCRSYADFHSGKCRSCGHDGSKCTVMGMDWEYYYEYDNRHGNNSYYLDTTNKCPYCNNRGIKFEGFQVSRPGIRPKCFKP